MDKNFYIENILKPLEAWCIWGERCHDKGARLIGFRPEISSEAVAHILFPPLNNKFIPEFIERMNGRNIPSSLVDLLSHVNGMYIFSGEIKIYGYIPLGGEKSKHFLDYPNNIMFNNGNLMVKGSKPTDITIGWYNVDHSYVNLEENGEIVRFKPDLPMQVIQTWSSLDTWLSSEIQRLASEWGPPLLR